MKDSKYAIKPSDLAEAIFDLGYLAFAFITAVSFFLRADGSKLILLCGVLALVLGGGDAFHLIPRVERAVCGGDDNSEARLGFGLFVSSVTMTIFYLILYEIWKLAFPAQSAVVSPIWPILLWSTAVLRIVLCLFPQNNWLHAEGNRKWSLMRNIPFAVTGLVMVILFAVSDSSGGVNLRPMSIAILISFACYFPVVLYAKKKPKIGMLMIPKTCAYIWMLVMLKQFL